MLFYGLIFALARWRAEGILGLVLAHGMMDLSAARMLPTLEVASLGKPEISCTIGMILGLVLLMALPLYLWKWHPDLKRSLTG